MFGKLRQVLVNGKIGKVGFSTRPDSLPKVRQATPGGRLKRISGLTLRTNQS